MTPESAAAAVLKNVMWPGTLPIDPARIANCYDIKVIRDHTLVGSTNSGRCLIDDEGNRIIIVNEADSYQRQRFTIAHELGHALLDGEGIHNRTETSYNLGNYRENEAKVNRFAAALLMPEENVHAALAAGKDLAQMAEIFGVSQVAMRIRLVRLGVLPDV